METGLPEIPKEIQTERLLLRMPLPGDGEKVNAAIRSSLDELKPWLPFVQTLPTPEETEINLLEAHIQFLKRENLRYLIFHRNTGDFIGTTGFHDIEWEIPKMEIGYWIDTKWSGSGYMVEAVEALNRLAIEGFLCRRVEIRCDAKNSRSRAIPEKLGFVLEGILRNDELSVDGKRLTDTCIYAKIT
ncbi:GNAT family N-acetyltransferase [Planomicrobium sp. CPCC 101079]|uniref:GNAT family N-acetyltransferase n=1 Tax=Planomicrobium sp. CPCC 101079 TaxID=2599618 RepID=UPI0011B85C59|nr:GNAT family N-acetyltransferase [Planomicrobium sp. CPCC 101079]TWT02500.1 GNAT family N-acetyltransferase [Planomicrobium sp. CPCC 101079]